MTLFKKENMKKELQIDQEVDVVLVMRDRDGEHDFMLHLPPFKGDDKKFPPHIGTAITIAACLYEKDKEFHDLIKKKFNQYSKEYLDRVYPGEANDEKTMGEDKG